MGLVVIKLVPTRVDQARIVARGPIGARGPLLGWAGVDGTARGVAEDRVEMVVVPFCCSANLFTARANAAGPFAFAGVAVLAEWPGTGPEADC